MRTVHEFHGKPQAGGCGHAYVSKKRTFPGFYAELVVTDVLGKKDFGDTLEIEGDGESIRAALQELLAMLSSVKEGAELEWRERTTRNGNGK